MNSLNYDLINIIISFNNNIEDIINIKYVNKFYYNVYYNYIDSIIFIENIDDLHSYKYYKEESKSIYSNNIVIINNIKQLNLINPDKIIYLNLSYYPKYDLYGDEFIWFSEDTLELFKNVRYLNVDSMELSYIPKTLIKIEYLDVSNNHITRIPKSLINLKVLNSSSDITDGLKYIPSNIMDNLYYLECPDFLRHDIILNKQKIKYALIGLNNFGDINKKNNIYLRDANTNMLENITPMELDINYHVYQYDESIAFY